MNLSRSHPTNARSGKYLTFSKKKQHTIHSKLIKLLNTIKNTQVIKPISIVVKQTMKIVTMMMTKKVLKNMVMKKNGNKERKTT